MAYCHKREDLSRLQRSEELRGALKSSGRNLGDLTLDVGCGKGYVVNLLNELGRQVVGLDIKPGFVRGMMQRRLHYKPILVLPIPPLLFGKYFWFETDFFSKSYMGVR